MGESGSCSGGKNMLSKTLIQFSVDGWGCVPVIKSLTIFFTANKSWKPHWGLKAMDWPHKKNSIKVILSKKDTYVSPPLFNKYLVRKFQEPGTKASDQNTDWP